MTTPSICIYHCPWGFFFLLLLRLCQSWLRKHWGIEYSALLGCSRESWLMNSDGHYLHQRDYFLFSNIVIPGGRDMLTNLQLCTLGMNHIMIFEVLLCFTQKSQCLNGMICSVHRNVKIIPHEMTTLCSSGIYSCCQRHSFPIVPWIRKVLVYCTL